MKVQLAAQLSKVETRADRSVKLVFDTRELGEDSATLFKLAHSEGWLIFASTELTEADIPDEKADSMMDGKTPSQRLRSRLFVYYMNMKVGRKENFQIWYMQELERIGNRYLEKLDADR